jgi:two-component system, NarL family, response regulator DevR
MDHIDAQRHEFERAPAPDVTCVVVDDHPAVLGTVCDLIASSGFNVVGRARTVAEGRAKIERRVPTIAILDLRLPDGSGTALSRELKESAHATRVIIYTSLDDPSLVAEAFAAGARAYVLKDSPLSTLVRALETVASGGTYVDPALAGDAG